MPHKHTRRLKDESTFDLPPSQVARNLPVKPKPQQQSKGKPKPGSAPQPDRKLKRKRDAGPKDDAPRAFKRLMAFAGGKKPRSGLDNGEAQNTKTKKRKAAQVSNAAADESKEAEETKTTKTTSSAEVPTIRPGERMSEFSARVDAAMPITGLINKSVRGNNDPLGLKKWQTKKERKMHKLYDEWREEERRAKDQKEEEVELQAEKDMEDEEAGVTWKMDAQADASGKKKKKKGKRSKYLGETAEAEEDPWEVLKKKRGETRPGLHDVVLAPPELTAKPSKKLLVRGAAVDVDGIPKSAGSLKRREELQSVRTDVIASYRKLMDERRTSLRTS
ncbi:Uu.00g084240.m01.CDS01 [Anthostomella pinea]|uniref:Uu.00g084240.m01.CDS01 n=1 Tax=Anthostomella pinea TaxID=933095 RepID=A0AAI8VGC1_9PEZI|nr:Uu.00g084240.m01.CDS01 [Anthostomella pinea]